jgi:hypothetical protein
MPKTLAILANRKSRRFRIFGYLLLAAAGTFLILANELFVYQPWIWTTMAGFLALGGTLCAIGQWKRIWPPEYIGLPLVWTAMLVFTVLQLAQWKDSSGVMLYLGIANTSLLLAYSILLFSRWLDVAAVFRAAKEYADAQR